MVNRKRPIILRCPVTAEERSLIEQKMSQLQTKRIGAYLRKMAIDGYIIYVDTKDIKEMNKLLSAIGRNINQIAKRVNAGGPTYQADMEEIRERLDQIWQLQRRILLGVSGRYPVIPPIKLPVLRTTENRCSCADFLPSANESHLPKNLPRIFPRRLWCWR